MLSAEYSLEGLVQARSTNDYQALADIFLQYARVYLTKKDYIPAMLLYRSALTLTELPNYSSVKEKADVNEMMRSVESAFLTTTKMAQTSTASLSGDRNSCYKNKLEKIIKRTKVRLAELNGRSLVTEKNFVTRANIVNDIYEEINSKLSVFLREIIVDCDKRLIKPPAPCRYSFILLGSFAKKRATPFSDIEFAILIGDESDNPTNREYLRNLVTLFNLKIIQLGHTSIPLNFFKSELNFDDLIPPGLQFDLGGKTPLGRSDKKYNLIQTPVNMVKKYLSEKGFAKDKLLPVELSNCIHLFGDAGLTKDYLIEVEKFFSENIEGIPQYKARATKILLGGLDGTNVGDIEKYQPYLVGQDFHEGRLYNVKKDLYRGPDRFLEGLALYYGIIVGSTWKKLSQLEKKANLSQKNIDNLKIAETISAEIRLRTYTKYRTQCELMGLLERSSLHIDRVESKLGEVSSYIFYLPDVGDESNSLLFRFYYTMLPFYEKLSELYKIENRSSQCLNLRDARFFDNSALLKGKIYARLMYYKVAVDYLKSSIDRKYKGLLRQFREKNKKISGGVVYNLCKDMQLLALCYQKIQKLNEARLVQTKIKYLRSKRKVTFITPTPAYIESKGSVAKAFQESIQEVDAKEAHNEAVLKHNEALLELNCKQYQLAYNLANEALNIYKELYPDGNLSIMWTYTTIGTICLLWSECFWVENSPSELKKYRGLAEKNFRRAQTICRSLLKASEDREGLQINLARLLLNWSSLNNLDANYETAKLQCEEALPIFRKYFGEIHPYTAKIYETLGSIFGYALKNRAKQSEFYKDANNIYESLKLENAGEPLDMVRFLVIQANLYINIREYPKAQELVQQAYLEFRKCISLACSETECINQREIYNIISKLKNNEDTSELLDEIINVSRSYVRICLRKAYAYSETKYENCCALVSEAFLIWQAVTCDLDGIVEVVRKKHSIRNELLKNSEILVFSDEPLSKMILDLSYNAKKNGKPEEAQEFKELNDVIMWHKKHEQLLELSIQFPTPRNPSVNCQIREDILPSFTNLVEKRPIRLEDLLSWITKTEIIYASLINKFEEITQERGIGRILAYTALIDFFNELSADKNIPTKFTIKWTKTEDHAVITYSEEIIFTEEAISYLEAVRKGTREIIEKLSKEGISFNIAEALGSLTQHEKQIEKDQEISPEVIKSHIQQEISEQGIAKVSEKYFGDCEGFFYPIYADREQAKVIKVIKTLYVPRPEEKLRKIAINTFLHPELEVRKAKITILDQAIRECWEEVHKYEPKLPERVDVVQKYRQRKVIQQLMNISLFLNAKLVNYRKDVLGLSKDSYIERTLMPLVKLDGYEKDIIGQIKAVEQKFLQYESHGAKESWSWDQDIKHKEILEQIRAQAKAGTEKINIDKGNLTPEEVQGVRQIYQGIAADIKQILALRLIKESISYLGALPGDFAVLGLGSLAREEMTPYSDFEFAILVKEDAPEIREYFYHFSVLINFMVMNLGETVIPRDTFEISFEDFISPGFQLDLGGKTPLGRLNQNYELIQTPKKMADYVKEEAFNRGRWLPMEMSTYTYICGDPELWQEYQQQVELELNKPIYQAGKKLGKDTPLTVRQARALKFLSKDADRFDPNLHNSEKEGKLLRVKEEIYRLPNTMLEGLALYYGINGTFNTWGKIEKLCADEKISKDGSVHLQEVFSIATYLRLIVYQNCHAQNETVSVLFSLEPTKPNPQGLPNQRTKTGYYKFSSQQTKIFTEVYKILIPLHKIINEQIRFQGKVNKLTNAFYDESSHTMGKIASRLCDYVEAEKQFNKTVDENPRDILALRNLGTTLVKLKRNKGTLEALNKALKLALTKHGENHIETAKIYVDLSNAHDCLSQYKQQRKMLKQALLILEKNYGENHVEVAKILVNLGNAYGNLRKYVKQKTYLEQALLLLEKFSDKDSVEIAITIANLSNAYANLGDCIERKTLLERALAIEERFYGKKHLEVAKTLVNLGNTYGDLGDYAKQKILLENALAIEKSFYDENSVEMAKTLGDLGSAYGSLGKYEQQKTLLEQALAILRDFYGEEHVEITPILINLSDFYGYVGDYAQQKSLLLEVLPILKKVYNKKDHVEIAKICGPLATAHGSLGEYKEQKKLLKNVVKIFEKTYGSDHVQTATARGNLGNAYGNLENYEKQKTLLEPALKIHENFYNPNHVKIAPILISLGNAYDGLKDYKKQKTLLERALEIQKNFYGPEHAALSSTHYKLAITYKNLKEQNIAQQHLKSAYEICSITFGSKHKRTLDLCAKLIAETPLIDQPPQHSIAGLISTSREQMNVCEQKPDEELLKQQEEIQLQYALELSKKEQHGKGTNGFNP